MWRERGAGQYFRDLSTWMCPASPLALPPQEPGFPSLHLYTHHHHPNRSKFPLIHPDRKSFKIRIRLKEYLLWYNCYNKICKNTLLTSFTRIIVKDLFFFSTNFQGKLQSTESNHREKKMGPDTTLIRTLCIVWK